MIARTTSQAFAALVLPFLLALAASLAAAEGTAEGSPDEGEEKPPTTEEILARAFPDFDGAFVLYDPTTDHTYRHNEARCEKRFPPLATFEIPHTLIALELGIIADADVVRPWDQEKHPPEEAWTPGMHRNWGRDHSLRTAYQFAAAWFFKDLAEEIGATRMKTFLERFRYGNQQVSEPLDGFWLGQPLAISADEQVAFLRAFLADELELAASVTALGKEILVLEKRSGYRLSGKTSSRQLADGRYLGWSVGYLERDGKTYVFAANFEHDSFAEVSKQRIAVAKRVFAALGLLRGEP